MKFRTDTPGFVTGIRYYRPSQATGTHVGSLWTSTGTRLGQVTFTGGIGQRLAGGDLQLARSR